MQAQIIRTYKAHEQRINALASMAVGRRIVSGSEDGTLRVWHLDSDEAVLELQGHDGPPQALAAFPDGQFMASGGRDHRVMIWNAATGEPVRTINGHKGAITALTISPDGKLIVSGSEDTHLRIWNSVTGKVQAVCAGHKSAISTVAVSPDNRFIVSAEAGAGDDRPLVFKVWDSESGQRVRDFQEPHEGVTHIVFDADGKRVISGSSEGDVKIWDWETGAVERVIETHLGSAVTTLMPNKRYALVGTQRPVLTLWSLETGQHLNTLDEPSNWVSSLVTTRDGRYILAGCHDGMLNVYLLTH